MLKTPRNITIIRDMKDYNSENFMYIKEQDILLSSLELRTEELENVAEYTKYKIVDQN